MRILSAEIYNFASYKDLEFNFDSQGLCLIQGPTGSGKSTLCDIIPWVLFGITAKNGGVDEIKSWHNQEFTEGEIILELNLNRYSIVRRRGKANDLYYSRLDDDAAIVRGKDLNDTQKQINNLLGIDASTYLSGAYFHEFSQTAQFFSTSAKVRRSICEQIVDLSLATILQEKIKDKKKLLRVDYETFSRQVDKHLTALTYLEESLETTQNNLDCFDADKVHELLQLSHGHQRYEQNKKETILEITKKLNTVEINLAKDRGLLKDLKENLKDEVCKTCGTHLDVKTRQTLSLTENNYKHKLITQKQLKTDLDKLLNQSNPYDKQIEMCKIRTNDYQAKIEQLQIKLIDTHTDLEVAEEALTLTKQKMLDTELLGEIVDTFRATQISSTVGFIEDKTNSYLSEYFDAEIKVVFSANNADKIDVEIYKDGNKCVYTQLSKGQRQLLKLCFGISVMKAVQNAKGISFNSIFLDESLDGLGDDLKVKSYRLFTSLALDYSSVFFVDHSSELKAIAESTFKVSINNGESTIEKA